MILILDLYGPPIQQQLSLNQIVWMGAPPESNSVDGSTPALCQSSSPVAKAVAGWRWFLLLGPQLPTGVVILSLGAAKIKFHLPKRCVCCPTGDLSELEAVCYRNGNNSKFPNSLLPRLFHD